MARMLRGISVSFACAALVVLCLLPAQIQAQVLYGSLVGNVTTPTLIHVGGNDDRCPPGHSRMLYRALKEYVDVPTQLVVYPGEPHGLTKLSNRKAKMEWDLAWFEKYLKT